MLSHERCWSKRGGKLASVLGALPLPRFWLGLGCTVGACGVDLFLGADQLPASRPCNAPFFPQYVAFDHHLLELQVASRNLMGKCRDAADDALLDGGNLSIQPAGGW